MNPITKLFLLVMLALVAWVLVEMWLQKKKQRKLADDVAERLREKRRQDVLYPNPERRRAPSSADVFMQRRQDETAD